MTKFCLFLAFLSRLFFLAARAALAYIRIMREIFCLDFVPPCVVKYCHEECSAYAVAHSARHFGFDGALPFFFL